MNKFILNGQEVIITCNRRIDEFEFNRACTLISKIGDEILKLDKSSIVLLHDPDHSYVLIERMNTDTYTIHIHYEISNDKVYKIW